MARTAQRRHESSSFRLPRAYTSQLRVELLEDRITPVNGQWLAVFEGLPVGANLTDQAQYGRNLLSAAGVPADEVAVARALDLSGTLLLQTPLDATERTLTTELQDVPGFVFVQDYVPPPADQIRMRIPKATLYDGLYGTFDYEAYLARELRGEIPSQAGLVEPTALIDTPGNNNGGATATANFTQSETTIAAFGDTVVLGFNDSGSFVGGAQKFTGWSYSTDGGNTFFDGGTLPTNPGGDAGDPVLARNETTGRIYFSTLGFDGLIKMFRSDDGGASWTAPVNATPGGSSEDKQWHTVDNFAGPGNGNVYMLSRRFGGSPGIYFFRSTDHGNTFGPTGGTLITPGAQGAFIAVGPDHAVYAFWFAGSTIQVRKSTDQGLTFGPARTVATFFNPGGVNGDLGLVGVRQGTTTPASFRSSKFPHVAVNPVSGHIYVTYADDAPGTDKADVKFAMSTDGGLTWSVPVRVNTDATTTDQWMPTIAVTPDGTKVGIFYSSRAEDPVNNNLFKHYGSIGTVSGSTVTFGENFAVSDAPSFPEFGRDGVVNSVYMGDYNHAVATPGAFHVVWSDNRDNHPLAAGAPRKDPNVYYKKISLGLTVTSTTPAVGTTVAAVPLDYVVNFSEPINTATVQPSDFTVTNDAGTPVPADEVVVLSPTQVRFRYHTAPFGSQGSHTMAMAAGAVSRLSDGAALAAFSGSFNLDLVGLAVVSTAPAAGGVFALPGPFTLVVNFNEPIAASSVGLDDLTLSAGTVTAAVVTGPNQVTYTLGGITAEGVLTVTLAAGRVTDTLGNANPAAFIATYSLDIGTTAYPTPLTPRPPFGSLVYHDPVASGVITPPGDTDSFTLTIDPGQRVTVVVRPTAATLRPTVTLRGPGGEVLGTATAPGLNQNAILQTVLTLTGGTYTITVEGAGGTTGGYQVQIVLNAAEEFERNAGQPSNNTSSTAQNIDASAVGLGGSASRLAVLGRAESTVTADFYALTLAAGETVTVSLLSASGGAVDVWLLNAASQALAQGVAGAANLTRQIGNLVVPASGTYYLGVTGTPGTDYVLVVTRDADLDTEANDSFGTARNIAAAGGVLGYVEAGGGGLVRVSSFNTFGLGTVIGLGHDPATGNLFTYGQSAGQISEFTPAGAEVLPRINRPGSVTDSLDLDFFGEAVSLGGTLVPAGSLLVVNGLDGPDTVYALNKDTGAVIASLGMPGVFNTVGGTYHTGRNTLYMIDWSADLIREVNPATGAVLATFPVVPAGSPAFDIFYGDLDVDPATGNLLLVSSSQSRIRVLTPTGGFVRDMDVTALSVSGMSGIAVNDGNGDMWVSTTSGTVIRLSSVSPGDWYSFAVNAGDNLVVQTSTPAAGAGEFVNNLNPRIELYNPAGALVASGVVLGDGRNELITHAATATGLYRVRVLAEGAAAGEYFVSVSGNTGTALPPFLVTGTTPANGAVLLTAPTVFTVNFNDAVLQSSLDATDLTINGVSATSFSVVGGGTVSFFLPALVPGTQTVVIAAGAILDAQGTPVQSFSSTFFVDNGPPRVAGTSVAPGGVVAPGSVTYQVTFSEPMRVANLTADDFSLRGNIRGANYTASSFSFNAAGTILTLNYTGLPDDNYTLTLVAGANGGSNFTDVVGNALDGEFTGTFPSGNGAAGGNFLIGFNADAPGAESYPALTAKGPAGGLIYDPSVDRVIAFPGDTDSFSLNVDAGQTITVLVTPGTSSFRPMVLLKAPSGAVIASAAAAVGGQAALLQTAAATAGGTYTIVVEGAASTIGKYVAQVVLNAAQEAEGTLAGVGNNTRATAQDINGSFLTLQTAQATARRGAVLGGDFGAASANGFTINNGPFSGHVAGLWHLSTGRGSQTGHSPTNSFYFGQGEGPAGGGNYDVGNTAGHITSPAITLPTGAVSLSFNYVLQHEGGSWDIASVQVSNNGGASFTIIAASNTGLIPASSTWRPISFNLSSFAGQTVLIRFNFDTRDSIANNFEGWYVDDVRVTAGSSVVFSADFEATAWNDYYSFTAAAGEVGTIALEHLTGTGATLTLENAAGVVLATGVAGSTNYDLGIRNFTFPAAGTYYVRVSGNTTATYSVVVTRDAAFDTEANDSSATAQPLGGADGALGATGSGDVGGAPVRVAVVGSSYAAVVAGQLNNDTYFNFTATVVSPAQVDTAAELSNYDVVVLGDYPVAIPAATAGAIRAWVEAGLGGIVSTAWINYNMYYYSGPTVASILDPIVPINLSPADPNYWYTPASAITITNALHPVTQGVTNFSPGYGEAPPTPDAGAVVLGTENYYGRPAVVVNQAGGGRTVYLTPAYGYDGAWTTGPADRLLEQAVAWSAPVRETADWYAIDVTSTAHPLRLETATPAGGPGEFANALNPKIELYSPSGVLLASGTVLADGRNEFIQYTPTATGLYRVRVSGEAATAGEYFLGVNFLPVARDDAAATVEDTEVAVNVLANDADPDGTLDPATVTIVSGPAHGSVSVTAAGVVTYTPNLNYFGSDSFTYTVKDNDGAVSNVATVSLTIVPVNDAPTVTPAPAEQSVQYSDPVAAVTVAAADVDSNGSSLSVTTSYTVDGGAAVAGLPNGLSLALASTTEGGPFPGGPAGARSWTIGGIADVAPGVYTVTAVVSDNHPTDPKTATTTFTITVNKEDARATYTGAQFVSTSTETSSTATITLAATIRDITAVLPGADPNAGDIRRATVTFVNRDTGTDIMTVPLGLVDPSDPKVATAVYNWAVDIGAADSAMYTVGIRVNGWYTRDSAADDVVVTVAKPLDSFVTGGGHLVLTNSAGLKAGDVGSKANFGFGVKFNQSGTNLQGRFTLLTRRTEADGMVHVYQVKSSTITSLAIQPATATGPARATVTGRASITDVTDPLNPIPVEGNATIQLVMTDASESGTDLANPDTIAVTVWNKSGGMWFSTRWNGAQTVEQALAGGNVMVKPAGLAAQGQGGGGMSAAPLTPDAVQPLLTRVIDLWRDAGVSPKVLAAASAANVVVTDLAGDQLGAATPGTIWLDLDAAGTGWFVDPSPENDAEFATPGDQGEWGRIDLLTVLAHEFGHLLGHDHDEEGVMSETLGAGVRVLPTDEHDHDEAGHPAGEDHAAEEAFPWAVPFDDASGESFEGIPSGAPDLPEGAGPVAKPVAATVAPFMGWAAEVGALIGAVAPAAAPAAEDVAPQPVPVTTHTDDDPEAGVTAVTYPTVWWQATPSQEPIWVGIDLPLDSEEWVE